MWYTPGIHVATGDSKDNKYLVILYCLQCTYVNLYKLYSHALILSVIVIEIMWIV